MKQIRGARIASRNETHRRLYLRKIVRFFQSFRKDANETREMNAKNESTLARVVSQNAVQDNVRIIRFDLCVIMYLTKFRF